MSHYHHLSTDEREMILILHAEKRSLRSIGAALGRSASTISRELMRNATAKKSYSAVAAERKYQLRRKRCRRHKLLENPAMRKTVRRLFLEQQWSPEEIANRLKYEESQYSISYATIYRAIYAGILDEEKLSHGNRGVIRKLRHQVKPGIVKVKLKHVERFRSSIEYMTVQKKQMIVRSSDTGK